MKIKCAFCEKIFNRSPSLIKGRKNVFCSRICHNKFRTTSKIIPCAYCGRSFKLLKCDIDRQFCSRDCRDKAQRKISDNEIILLWNKFKDGSIALSQIVRPNGLKRYPIRRLRKLISQEEYNHVMQRKGIYPKNHFFRNFSKEDAEDMFVKWEASRLPLKIFAKEKANISYSILSKLFKEHMRSRFEDLSEKHKVHNYQRGRDLEYKVRDIYAEKGYFVLRSPRSGGPADIVALKRGEIVLIQCKARKNLLSRRESDELVKLAESLSAKAVLAYRMKGIKFEELT